MSRPSPDNDKPVAERKRLIDDESRTANWKRWGPYLSERQWGTVREDYSADGEAWNFFTHDHSRSRTYRWGEDGLLGLTDRQGRFCFSVALWNGKDPYLKERLFGLTGPQGNHGEDVKEEYFYLESTPTHSYMKGLYKYPQAEFPYQKLVDENAKRSKSEDEYELKDTGVFDQNRYFDVQIEYAKAGPDDLLIRIEVFNRGPDAATIDCLPTFWFRNTWSLGRTGEGYWPRPKMQKVGPGHITMDHVSLGKYHCLTDEQSQGGSPPLLFTENETNDQEVFGTANVQPYVKDAFHRFVVDKDYAAIHPGQTGTKAAAHYHDEIAAGQSVVYRTRICCDDDLDQDALSSEQSVCGCDFDAIFQQRIDEANEFYEPILKPIKTPQDKAIARQAYAGLMWTKQFYFYSVKEWLEGDPNKPAPPASRQSGRNSEWMHLYNRDVVSMPDKWEYPWYAAWDLAFHMLPIAKIDPRFAKNQLQLFLREWYMSPSGQIPAYEFGFSDANPPVHAWAALRVYQISREIEGKSDHKFLAKVFHKLLINFTWWINRKDGDGNHIFSGGFLGLDNIGVFDRSEALPWGERLDQADATAWMAFYCITMLSIALELAREDSSYEDVASKFFEHFVTIADAMNSLGGNGLWDEEDGFFYDHLHRNDQCIPLRIRSMVGLLPIAAAGVLDSDLIDQLPGFKKRMVWFLNNQKQLASQITYLEQRGSIPRLMLAIPSRERLQRILTYMLDEAEFLSPHGIRSMSRALLDNPFNLQMNDQNYEVAYTSGESDSGLFGGNSNWRGPIWFPVNFLLIEALETYHHFYGDTFKIEYPTGSGNEMTLDEVARNLSNRLAGLLRRDDSNGRPSDGADARYANDANYKDLVLFYEYFDGDTGRGLGASHQTGWTALIINCLERCPGEQKK